MNSNVKYLLTLLFSVNFLFGFSQSVQNLQQKKERIQRKIENISKILNKTKKSKKNTLQYLTLLKKKISLRKELITNIDNEINHLNDQLFDLNIKKDSIERQLLGKKDHMSALLVRLSRILKDKHTPLYFILSSKNFSQAYLRLSYYKKLLTHYSKAIDDLKVISNSYEKSKLELENTKRELKNKQLLKQIELKQLIAEQNGYMKKFGRLKRSERQLRVQLRKEKRKRDNLANRIRKLIAEEARRNRNNSTLNAKNLILSKKFEENRGKFKIPVQPGTIISEFGEHFHPVLKSVKIRNNGVDIATTGKSPVCAIFNGKVSRIIKIPQGGIAVIVRHGNFLTVYSNLGTVFVKVGESVQIGERIGKLIKNSSDQYVLHFEIWNERKPENPAEWLHL